MSNNQNQKIDIELERHKEILINKLVKEYSIVEENFDGTFNFLLKIKNNTKTKIKNFTNFYKDKEVNEIIKSFYKTLTSNKEEEIENQLFIKTFINNLPFSEDLFSIIEKIPEIELSAGKNVEKNLLDILKENQEEDKIITKSLIEELFKRTHIEELEINQIKDIIDVALNNIDDVSRKEIIETISSYFDLKNDINPEELQKILRQVLEEESLEPMIKDMNKYTLEPLFENNEGKRTFKTNSAGIPDIEFFYFKQNSNNEYELYSKSGSITKAGIYHFEGSQNNFHSYRTKLKNYLISNYFNQEKIAKDFSMKEILKQNENLPKRVRHLLNEINSLDEKTIYDLQISGASLEQIEKYLDIFIYRNNEISKQKIENKQKLNTLLTEEWSIQKYLENPSNFVTNYFSSLDYFEMIPNGVDKEGKTKYKRRKYDKENEIDKKALIVRRSLHIFSYVERTSNIKSSSISNIEELNELNHSHRFSVINNSIYFEGEENLTTFVLGASHIINEYNFQNLYKDTKGHTQITKEYKKHILETHKNWLIQARHITKGKHISYEPINFLELLNDNNKMLEVVDKMVELLLEGNNLNQIKKNNMIMAIDVLFTLKIDNEVIRNKLTNLFKEKPGLEQIYALASSRDLAEQKTSQVENKLIINIIKEGIKDNKINRLLKRKKITEKDLSQYRIYAEEEILIDLLEDNGKEELVDKIESLKEKEIDFKLSKFLVEHYLENNTENKNSIISQIELLKSKYNMEELPIEMEEELERQIQEILNKDNIDISKEETKELSKEITKTTINRFGK